MRAGSFPGPQDDRGEPSAMLDGQMAGKEFLCGPRFTLADMLLYCWIDFGGQIGQPLDPATPPSRHGLPASVSGRRCRLRGPRVPDAVHVQIIVIASGAKQSTLAFLLPHGLLRFARNDVERAGT